MVDHWQVNIRGWQFNGLPLADDHYYWPGRLTSSCKLSLSWLPAWGNLALTCPGGHNHESHEKFLWRIWGGWKGGGGGSYSICTLRYILYAQTRHIPKKLWELILISTPSKRSNQGGDKHPPKSAPHCAKALSLPALVPKVLATACVSALIKGVRGWHCIYARFLQEILMRLKSMFNSTISAWMMSPSWKK